MNKTLTILFNSVFFLFVIALAVAVSTIAITKKVNEYNSTQHSEIVGTVMKDEIPVMALSRGVAEKVNVEEGKAVKKGQLLVEVSNPTLENRLNALKEYPDNLSAKTEAKVVQEELENLNVVSPTDGVVAGVSVTDGTPVDSFEKVASIYSSDNVRILVEVTYSEYPLIKDKKEITVLSERLNQSFVLKRDILKPEESVDKETKIKKIGVYYTFANKKDVNALLNNETLIVQIAEPKIASNKPIDLFINFWNGLLARENQS